MKKQDNINSLYDFVMSIRSNRKFTYFDVATNEKLIFSLPKTIKKAKFNNVKKELLDILRLVISHGGALVIRLKNNSQQDMVLGIAINPDTGDWVVLDAESMRKCYCTCSECGDELSDDGTIYIDASYFQETKETQSFVTSKGYKAYKAGQDVPLDTIVKETAEVKRAGD